MTSTDLVEWIRLVLCEGALKDDMERNRRAADTLDATVKELFRK